MPMLPPLLASALQKALQIPKVDRLYAEVANIEDRCDFAAEALKRLQVEVRVLEEDLDRIPSKGPVVVVANHPYGMLDGFIVLAHLVRRRPDAKAMANFVLHRFPKLQDFVIGVDPFGGPEASRRNVAGLKQCFDWLRAGRMLIVFPSGEVSHLHLNKMSVIDPEWNSNVAASFAKPAQRRCRSTSRVPTAPCSRWPAWCILAFARHCCRMS